MREEATLLVTDTFRYRKKLRLRKVGLRRLPDKFLIFCILHFVFY